MSRYLAIAIPITFVIFACAKYLGVPPWVVFLAGLCFSMALGYHLGRYYDN